MKEVPLTSLPTPCNVDFHSHFGPQLEGEVVLEVRVPARHMALRCHEGLHLAPWPAVAGVGARGARAQAAAEARDQELPKSKARQKHDVQVHMAIRPM